MILGHGIDLVPVSRVAGMIADHRDRFLERCFTTGERAYCEGRKNSAEHFAARFAAKEAILKALGTGWSGGIAWTDAEVVVHASGKPTVVLRGKAAEIASVMGVKRWFLSLTHAEGFATASAIAEG